MDNELAFLLHSRPYRETSLIAHFFVRNLGIISAVVRGARKSKQKLFPFTLLHVDFAGKSSLLTVKSMENASQTISLMGDALLSGFYLNELLMRLLPEHDSHPELFEQYQRTVQRLSESDSVQPILREFEFFLLHELGYGFSWEMVGDGKTAIVAEGDYLFDAGEGFFPIEQTHTQAIKGQYLQDVYQKNWHAASLKAAKQIMRLAFAPLLGKKPLKTREFFREMS